MGSLTRTLIVAGLISAAPAQADIVERWNGEIARAAERFNLPPGWIRDVMRVESGGRRAADGKPIVSRAGAMGLMQLMPQTWRDMRLLLSLGPDPHRPDDNIMAGTAYLRAMFDRFGYPGLFAAYNLGPSRYAAYRATGRPLPRETRAYLSRLGAGPADDHPSARSGTRLVRSRDLTRKDERLIPTGEELFAKHRPPALFISLTAAPDQR